LCLSSPSHLPNNHTELRVQGLESRVLLINYRIDFAIQSSHTLDMRGRLCFSKKTFFLFSILAGVTSLIILYTFANSTLLTKKNTSFSHAIYGGTVAATNAYPYFVKLRTSRGTCGGTLIHHSYILTAAHCVEFITKNKDGGSLFALIGVNSYSGDFYGQYPVIIRHTSSSPSITIHPKYVEKTALEYNENDIALINTRFALYPVPVPVIPSASQSLTSLPITIVGVGAKTITSYTASKTLQDATLKVSSVDSTQFTFKAKSDNSSRKAGCPGDSGGPALSFTGSVPTVVGIIIGGWCNLADESTFVSVLSYRSWITGIIGSQPPYPNTIFSTSVFPTQAPLAPVCATKTNAGDCNEYIDMCYWNSKNNKCDVVK